MGLVSTVTIEGELNFERHSQTVPDLFWEQSQRLSTRPMVFSRSRHHWRPLTWGQMRRRVEQTAQGLLAMGLTPGERLAIMAESCIEWVIVDLACAAIGVTTIAISPQYPIDEVHHILVDSDAVAFVVDRTYELTDGHIAFLVRSGISLIVALQGSIPDVSERSLEIVGLGDIETRGRTHEVDLAAYRQAIKSDDLLTIIYTSGATGKPKGVMLSHRNVLSNCEAASRAVAVGPNDVLLSFLPLSHSFERLAGYYLPALIAGAQIYYSSGIERLLTDIEEVKPTIITGVPRLLERIYASILKRSEEQSVFSRTLLEVALSISPLLNRLTENRNQGFARTLTRANNIWLKRALAPVRRMLGSRLRFVVSGGAHLSKQTAEFFYAAGVLVLEGYGLTEAAPIVSVNRPSAFRFGTVGRPLDNVRLRLTLENEIMVKGPNVMLGYVGGNHDAGAWIDEEDWLHTGDLGRIDKDGYLILTGRKKALFKDSAGRYVSPSKIELALQQIPEIQYAVVVGEGRPFPVAILFAETGFSEAPAVEVERRLETLIAKACRSFARHERIRRFHYVTEPLQLGSGLLTPTMKPRRELIAEHYAAEVEHIYEVSGQQIRPNIGELVARSRRKK